MEPTPQPAPAPLPALFVLTERSLRAAPTDEEGFVAPRAAGAFDVVVGTASLDRALEAIRILLEQAEQAGIRITVDIQARTTLIQVGDELLPIRLRDRRRQITHRLTADERKRPTHGHHRWDYVPSGELSLQIDAPSAHGARRYWALGGSSRLPGQIAKCLSGLPTIAEAKKAAAIEAERLAREWAERRRRELEAERLREADERRRELLLQEVAAWHQCQTLRSYIEAMRSRYTRQRDPTRREKVERWLAWAHSIADSMDPVLQADAPKTERAMPPPVNGDA